LRIVGPRHHELVELVERGGRWLLCLLARRLRRHHQADGEERRGWFPAGRIHEHPFTIVAPTEGLLRCGRTGVVGDFTRTNGPTQRVCVARVVPHGPPPSVSAPHGNSGLTPSRTSPAPAAPRGTRRAARSSRRPSACTRRRPGPAGRRR